MKAMNIPGFTAEASFSKSRHTYGGTALYGSYSSNQERLSGQVFTAMSQECANIFSRMRAAARRAVLASGYDDPEGWFEFALQMEIVRDLSYVASKTGC
jgi:hypothetical protein